MWGTKAGAEALSELLITLGMNSLERGSSLDLAPVFAGEE
jgi:hypothetical protein